MHASQVCRSLRTDAPENWLPDENGADWLVMASSLIRDGALAHEEQERVQSLSRVE